MRLLDREFRAESSTEAAWVPTRITQASNFSVESRLALSAVIDTLSMPNCRKHSVRRFLDDSCRSTSAARAENFLEEDKDTREFPKAVSVRCTVWVGYSCPTLLCRCGASALARQTLR